MDVDIDVNPLKRDRILKALEIYYRKLGGEVRQVCTYSTEGTKRSIVTACNGLGLGKEVGPYIASLVPIERGFNLTFKQCYYGDDDHNPVKDFIAEIDQYEGLAEIVQAIEGLVCGRSRHACGIIISHNEFWEHNATMKTPGGELVSQFNLSESEEMSAVKMDLLSVDVLARQQASLNLLKEYGHVKPLGSLKEEYFAYLHEKSIDVSDNESWSHIRENEVPYLFQMTEESGKKGIRMGKPSSLLELASINSLIRLMKEKGAKESPLETYARYKKNLSEWYKDMTEFGLSVEQQRFFAKYIGGEKYGIAESQEDLMKIIMGMGQDLVFANKIRKVVAKKKMSQIQSLEKEIYERCEKSEIPKIMVDYYWKVICSKQLGYSFSTPHTLCYSLVGYQCAWLYSKYPSIYWNTANLLVDSGAISKDYGIDLDGLNEKDVEEIEAKMEKNSSKSRYGAIARAIAVQSDMGISVGSPDINASLKEFIPDEENNIIPYGLSAIVKMNDDLLDAILENRPYTNMNDFLNKVKVNRAQGYSLAMSGALDFGNPNREEVVMNMAKYFCSGDLKKKVDLRNAGALIGANLIPDDGDLEFAKRCFNFNKYIKAKKFKLADDMIAIDEIAEPFLTENFPNIIIVDNKIEKSKWDAAFNPYKNPLRNYISKNKERLVEELNNSIAKAEVDKYCVGNKSKWEMSSISCYLEKHELEFLDISKAKFLLTDFSVLPIGPSWNKDRKRQIYRIAGTVLEKDKNKNVCTILTSDNKVVKVKMHKGRFTKYDKQIYETVGDKRKIVERSWFTRGNILMFTGYRDTEDLFRSYTRDDSPFTFSVGKVEYLEGNEVMVKLRGDDQQ